MYNAAAVSDCGIVLSGIRRGRGAQRTIRGDMTANQESRHVFIVRIWLEPRELEGAAPQLRGTIEHVPSGMRRSVKALAEITDFIRAWLPETLRRPKAWDRLRQRKRDRVT